jgi:hypothetical protein
MRGNHNRFSSESDHDLSHESQRELQAHQRNCLSETCYGILLQKERS